MSSNLKLFDNGKIYTGEKFVKWMIIRDNRIVENGQGEKAWKGERIDLKGRLVIPGFHDSHIHVYSTGRFASRLNLKQIGSIKEMQKQLKLFSQKNRDTWVIGGGWDQDYFEENRYPTKSDIDQVIDQRPVLLYRGCNHIGLVNSKALQIMDITKQTVDPDGGKIDRNAAGEPTGILRENALDLVKPHISKLDTTKKREYFRRGVQECLRVGLTAVQTNDREGWKYYSELQRDNELPIRVFLTIPYDELDQMIAPKPQIGLLTCDRVKLFADGSLGAETAALREPYEGEDNQGILIQDQEELNYKVNRAHNQGFRLEVHAIGDRAAEVTINAFDNAEITAEDKAVITHCQVLGEDLVRKMSQKGIIANIQPPFVKTDSQWVEKRLGNTERLQYSYAWKTLLLNNVYCAGGSDAPIEIPDPLHGIHCAVFRENPNGQTWRPNECLSIKEAIDLYTSGSAFAANRENELGKLEEGYLADFVILKDDIFENPVLLKKTSVDEVWVDGKKQFQRDIDQRILNNE